MTERAAFLRRLAGAGGGGLESAAADTDLSAGRRTASLDRLAELLDRRSAETPQARAEADRLLADARDGLAALARPDSGLNPAMRIGLEAIILSDGSRPAVLVQDNRVDPTDPTLGGWVADVRQGQPEIADIARAVARVGLALDVAEGVPDPAERCIGTAFAVADGVVATNRHVLQAIARPDPCAEGGWRFAPGTVFDFGAEHERPPDPGRRFEPRLVRFAGPDEIGAKADLAHLDLALIALAPHAAGAFPKPLPLATDPEGVQPGLRLCAMGHPAAPVFGEVAERVLFRLFRDVFGVKRWSPGEVVAGPGGLPGDGVPPRCFSHDASTLGGSSGSCLVDLAGTWTVVGLHFGGCPQIENYAHALARIREHLP